jgi:DNA repair exonuclease SbcCD nuclease subunit
MSKSIFITDIHFSVRGGSQYYIERYKLFFENIFFPYIDKHNIETVYCLGDTWEDRKNINVNALKETRKMFFDELEKRGVQFVAILGNHDVFFRNTNETNSMDIIESSYKNVRIIDEYEEIYIGHKRFGFMSWVNNENLERNLERIKSTSTADILCGHFEIVGFEMTKGNVADKGFEQSLFGRFELVLSGHFHIKNKIGHIYYIGNPFQTNWDDYNSDRGFHVYDHDTNTFEFIKNTYENFDVIIYDDAVNISTFNFDKYKDQKIKVLVNNVAGLKQASYLTFLENLNTKVFEYTVVEINDESALIEDSTTALNMKSNTEMIKEYVNGLTMEDTEKSEVINIMLDLYNEAINLRESN